MEQAGKTGRADGQRHGRGGARHRRGKGHVRHVDHDPLAKRHRIEVSGIAKQGPLIVRAAGGIVEDGARHAPPGKLTQVVDTENHCNATAVDAAGQRTQYYIRGPPSAGVHRRMKMLDHGR
jgi:hypothetical protein